MKGPERSLRGRQGGERIRMRFGRYRTCRSGSGSGVQWDRMNTTKLPGWWHDHHNKRCSASWEILRTQHVCWCLGKLSDEVPQIKPTHYSSSRTWSWGAPCQHHPHPAGSFSSPDFSLIIVSFPSVKHSEPLCGVSAKLSLSGERGGGGYFKLHWNLLWSSYRRIHMNETGIKLIKGSKGSSSELDRRSTETQLDLSA